MALPARSNSVPKLMLPVYEKIVGLTDDVCDRHLNSEYRALARVMTGALCRKRPSPLASGQPRTWACGILYALGRINFLGDPSFSPHMTLRGYGRVDGTDRGLDGRDHSAQDDPRRPRS
jgi:uncharacterized protein DUF6398